MYQAIFRACRILIGTEPGSSRRIMAGSGPRQALAVIGHHTVTVAGGGIQATVGRGSATNHGDGFLIITGAGPTSEIAGAGSHNEGGGLVDLTGAGRRRWLFSLEVAGTTVAGTETASMMEIALLVATVLTGLAGCRLLPVSEPRSRRRPVR